jgi:cysteine desulfurase
MEIYLDANATTPVLAPARAAALQALADDFGNPSSVPSTGPTVRPQQAFEADPALMV